MLAFSGQLASPKFISWTDSCLWVIANTQLWLEWAIADPPPTQPPTHHHRCAWSSSLSLRGEGDYWCILGFHTVCSSRVRFFVHILHLPFTSYLAYYRALVMHPSKIASAGWFITNNGGPVDKHGRTPWLRNTQIYNLVCSHHNVHDKEESYCKINPVINQFCYGRFWPWSEGEDVPLGSVEPVRMSFRLFFCLATALLVVLWQGVSDAQQVRWGAC